VALWVLRGAVAAAWLLRLLRGCCGCCGGCVALWVLRAHEDDGEKDLDGAHDEIVEGLRGGLLQEHRVRAEARHELARFEVVEEGHLEREHVAVELRAHARHDALAREAHRVRGGEAQQAREKQHGEDFDEGLHDGGLQFLGAEMELMVLPRRERRKPREMTSVG
jgi:hypothetical protein